MVEKDQKEKNRFGGRALRGGSWNNQAENLRCSERNNFNPVSRDFNIGFRVVRPVL